MLRNERPLFKVFPFCMKQQVRSSAMSCAILNGSYHRFFVFFNVSELTEELDRDNAATSLCACLCKRSLLKRSSCCEMTNPFGSQYFPFPASNILKRVIACSCVGVA